MSEQWTGIWLVQLVTYGHTCLLATWIRQTYSQSEFSVSNVYVKCICETLTYTENKVCVCILDSWFLYLTTRIGHTLLDDFGKLIPQGQAYVCIFHPLMTTIMTTIIWWFCGVSYTDTAVWRSRCVFWRWLGLWWWW